MTRRGDARRRSVLIIGLTAVLLPVVLAGSCTDGELLAFVLQQVLSAILNGGGKAGAKAPDTEVWAPEGGSIYVAAAAHAAGSNGTNWRTDVVLHSVGDVTAEIAVDLLEHGRANLTPQQVTRTIAAGRCLSLGDLLADAFQFEGAAALRITARRGAVAATSRTYNLLGPGNPLGLPDGATFGQFIPAVGPSSETGVGEQASLIQLTQSGSTTTGFRTNLGLINTTAQTTVVECGFFGADGVVLGQVTTTLQPFEYRQLNRVLNQVAGGGIGDAYAVLSTSTPGSSFLAYASVVDNLTGDPVAMMAQVLPATGPVYVAAAAHVQGVGGTNWRTDLEVLNPGDDAVSFTVELLRHGQDNSDPTVVTRQLGAGRCRRFQDVLQTVFDFAGGAALRITPSSGQLMVTSRTYNLLGADNDLGLPAGSTFGQFIAAATPQTGIGPGDEGVLIQISEGEPARTNLVLLNTSLAQTSVEVELLRPDGSTLGTVDRALQPREYRQLNRILASVTDDDVQDGFARVRVTSGDGPVLALASVVDNATGDPIAIPAVTLREVTAATLEPQDVPRIAFGLAATMADDFGLDVEQAFSLATTLGVDPVVSGLAAALPGTVERNGRTITFDVGDAFVDSRGDVLSGSATINLTDFVVTAGTITGTASYDARDLVVNGDAVTFPQLEAELDLAAAGDRTVTGTVSVQAAAKNGGDGITGWARFDTAVCKRFPVEGTFTIILDGDEYTVVITPTCDGTWGEGDDLIVIDFDDLDPEAVVTDQYPEAVFSANHGYRIEILPFSWSSPPNCVWSRSGGATNGDLIVDFPDPVKDLSLVVFDAKPAGPFADVRVFSGGQLAATHTVQGTGSEDDLITVDLSAYANVTRLEFLNSYDDDTLLWDDIMFRIDD